MSTWYTVRFNKIDQVEVVRSSEKCVWLPRSAGDAKRARISEYACYFPTWDDAHQYLLAETEKSLLSARHRLATAQAIYGNVKGMKKTAETTP